MHCIKLNNLFFYLFDRNKQADKAYTDLYKVEGIRGVYIVSKITKPLRWYRSFSQEYLKSFITFDHGNSWVRIPAPSVDYEGRPVHCPYPYPEKCSLHVSGNIMSELYPVTRLTTIMSSKTIPGFIMATGVMGISFKAGYPGLYISHDAGQTWRHILRDYHIFNYGDHGGILVAAKYFKMEDEPNEILYSTDQGQTWLHHPLPGNNLKVHGIMSVPNAKATEFILFASESDELKWLTIKIDLINSFTSNCTRENYKMWSTVSANGECIMGKKETFHVRNADANCYNGPDYDGRPNRTEICECEPQDFECEYGFSRLAPNSQCTKTQEIVPEDTFTCRSGELCSKGYRKIEGNVCIDGLSKCYMPTSIPCPNDKPGDFLIVYKI